MWCHSFCTEHLLSWSRWEQGEYAILLLQRSQLFSRKCSRWILLSNNNNYYNYNNKLPTRIFFSAESLSISVNNSCQHAKRLPVNTRLACSNLYVVHIDFHSASATKHCHSCCGWEQVWKVGWWMDPSPVWISAMSRWLHPSHRRWICSDPRFRGALCLNAYELFLHCHLNVGGPDIIAKQNTLSPVLGFPRL